MQTRKIYNYITVKNSLKIGIVHDVWKQHGNIKYRKLTFIVGVLCYITHTKEKSKFMWLKMSRVVSLRDIIYN